MNLEFFECSIQSEAVGTHLEVLPAHHGELLVVVGGARVRDAHHAAAARQHAARPRLAQLICNTTGRPTITCTGLRQPLSGTKTILPNNSTANLQKPYRTVCTLFKK